MIHIKDTTLVAIAGVDVDKTVKALNVCTDYCSFDQIKLLTDLDTDYKYKVNIERLNSVQEYCVFVIKRLNDFIDTKYCLLVQWDGFILNPNAWNDEFYNYDYIGAPWYFMNNKVGNGGFSFRSKKLLEVCQKEDLLHSEVEDLCICHHNDMSKYGIKIAPSDIGFQFSTENMIYYNSFGFHDFKTDISLWKDKNKFGY